MKITLKDGSVKEYAEAKSVIETAAGNREGIRAPTDRGRIQ